MKGSKKVIISLSVLSAVLVAVVISMAAVLAAFQATATGGFNITYTAENINATVAASYTTGATPGTYTTIKSTDDKNEITFNDSDTDSSGESNKSFKQTNSTVPKNGYLYIKFVITNTDTGSTAFTVTGSSDITSSTNLTVKYANSDTAAEGAWKNSISEAMSGTSVTKGAPATLVVRISVDNKTMNATFTGSFSFELNIVE